MPASEAREALGSRGEDTDDNLRVNSARVRIETYPLRRWVERPEGIPPNPKIEMEIEFTLLQGHGGVINEARLELGEDVRTDLRDICESIPRILHFWLDKASACDEPIALEPGIARRFRSKKDIFLSGLPTEDIVRRLDELSVMIEEGEFTIHWQTSLRDNRSFRPSQINPDTPGAPI